MKRIIFILAIFFLSGIISCTKRNDDSSNNDEALLRGASKEWDELFAKHDPNGLSMLYAEDAISMPPGSPDIIGRNAIAKEFVRGFTNSDSASHHTSIDTIIRDNDIAIERAHYRIDFISSYTREHLTENGRHVECRKKIGGKWLIIWEIWNANK